MSGLVSLRLRAEPEAGLDLSPLLPRKLHGLGKRKIENVRLGYGSRQVPVAELFQVHGGSGCEELLIEGGSRRFHGLGADMGEGRIEVFGDVGDDCALGMHGGSLRVHGNSGDFTGSGLGAGTVLIDGNCGDDCGALRPGGHAAISGGLLQVRGRCGARAGAAMSGGMLLIEGKAGHGLAADIRAGTVLALAGCGPGMARGMKRGTLVVNKPGMRLRPAFADNGVFDLAVLRLIMNYIEANATGLRFLQKCSILVRRYTGDLSSGGAGEILVPVRDLFMD